MEEVWQTASTSGTYSAGSKADYHIPEWLADLSLFANPEPPKDVDWDAIIAYESDWRTHLAKATRE